ncbi:MAG TPA: RNA-binding protein hfq, partial [Alcanivorax sp.]|nr:RNA-binding protein hfq [Alcanivorax sp.]
TTVVPARNPRGGGNPAMTTTGTGGTAVPAADEGFGNQ